MNSANSGNLTNLTVSINDCRFVTKNKNVSVADVSIKNSVLRRNIFEEL